MLPVIHIIVNNTSEACDQGGELTKENSISANLTAVDNSIKNVGSQAVAVPGSAKKNDLTQENKIPGLLASDNNLSPSSTRATTALGISSSINYSALAKDITRAKEIMNSQFIPTATTHPNMCIINLADKDMLEFQKIGENIHELANKYPNDKLLSRMNNLVEEIANQIFDKKFNGVLGSLNKD